jgi:hypothetical protein
MEAYVTLDTGYLVCDGVTYAVTATVDEEIGVVYQVMVWHHPPIPGVAPLYDQFNASEARTPMQFAAFDRVLDLYGINPVIEEIS